MIGNKVPETLWLDLAAKGLVYEACAGCGKPSRDIPAAMLPAVEGRDCGCPAGTGWVLRRSTPIQEPVKVDLRGNIKLPALPREEAVAYIIQKLEMSGAQSRYPEYYKEIADFLRAWYPSEPGAEDPVPPQCLDCLEADSEGACGADYHIYRDCYEKGFTFQRSIKENQERERR